jgi:PAS domain S-box-containing protein
MHLSSAAIHVKRGRLLPNNGDMRMIQSTKIVSSFAAVLLVVGALGIAFYISTQSLIKNSDLVIHTHEVMEDLETVLSLLKDAESGQRGFVLTGQDQYLNPYHHIAGRIKERLATVTELTKDDALQQTALIRLQSLSASKMDELNQTIELRRHSGQEAALLVILTGRGVRIMEDIRELVAEMQQREMNLLRSRQMASTASARLAMWTVAGGIPLSLIVLAIAAIVLTQSGRSGVLIAGPPVEDSRWNKIAARYALAVLVALLASFLRVWLLKLGPMPLFVTYYPAVLLVAMVFGGGPGILVTILSALMAIYYFMPPYGHWSIESPADAVALAIFAGTTLSLCVVAERLRNSRWAEAFGLAKQQEAEKLAEKNEELAQQTEELSQQSEELTQQNEELQSQSEEIQTLNTELKGREEMLRKLLEAARLHSTEESVLRDVCVEARDIFGPSAAAVVICERQGNALSIRAQAGSRETLGPWPVEGAFPALVMQEGRTACLNDASLRPDLKLLRIPDAGPFQSALSTPLHVRGDLYGAVTVYSLQKQEWTTEQFRLVEWLATQCGHILETIQLQDQLRRTAEQNRLLSDLLEHSDQPFGIGYPDGKLGYVNAAFERLTGYSRKELEGMDWANVLTAPKWRPIERAKLDELHRTGQPARYEKEYIRKDGTSVPIELLVHLVTDERGCALHYYSFITDISERKQAEESLLRAKDELDRRVAERTAELAHRAAQLRALTGELTLAEQRERTRLAKILHDHLQQLLVAAKFRLAILDKGAEDVMKEGIKEVEQLIDESIASSRSLTAELSPPILHQAGLNAGLEWLAKRMADRQGLLVDLELEEIEPLPDDLTILLFESVRELLFNVAKHAQTRSSTISLRKVYGFLQLAVSDRGVGFDPAVMSRAGESGRGFGLFSVQERLELFGGKLEIRSAPGQGSRIFLSVPMPRQAAVPPPASRGIPPDGMPIQDRAPLSGSGRRIRVLLVDDHVVVRQGIGNMLSNEPDIEIVGEAADGQEAVDRARALKPDVILMDVSMPKLNGVEATRIIHGDLPETRIIGLSMFHEGEQADAMFEAGAVKYVSKSGATEAVIEAIRTSMS